MLKFFMRRAFVILLFLIPTILFAVCDPAIFSKDYQQQYQWIAARCELLNQETAMNCTLDPRDASYGSAELLYRASPYPDMPFTVIGCITHHCQFPSQTYGPFFEMVVWGVIINSDECINSQTSSDSNSKLSNLNIDSTGLNISLANGSQIAVNGGPLNTSSCDQASCGDPVNISTGFMWHETTDFKLSGKTPLTSLIFKRTYLAHPILTVKSMGAHWFHNFQTNIYPITVSNKTNLMWIDEAGGSYIFLKNTDGSYKNPDGFFGSLVEFSDHYELMKADKSKLVFTKDKTIAPVGSLISINEPHGEKISLSYDAVSGNLLSAETGLAGKVAFSYDANNYLTQITRVRDNLAYSYSYDSKGNLLSATDFNGLKTTYVYQSSDKYYLDGLMLSFTDPMGRTNSFQYDNNGRTITETEPGNATRFYSYAVDAAGVRSTQLTELDGTITNFIFDSNYRLIKTIHADSSIVNQAWNAQNLIDNLTDALGFKTNYQYDNQGNLILLQRAADSQPTTISYDLNFNKPNEIIPAVGAPTNFTIDQTTGDVLQVSRNNLSLAYQYDQLGNILSTNNGIKTYSDQTNGNGLKTTLFDARNPESLTYDIQGRVITRNFKNGRVLSYVYDNYDRITQVKDSNGPGINNTYDILGRLLTKEIAGTKNKEVTKYDWDIRGRLVQVTDNLGRKTQYQYNNGNTTSLVIDKPSAIISPDGKVTSFKYDIMQRLIQKIDAKNFSTKYEYDLRGDVTKITDAKGAFTNFSYDGNRRLKKQDSPTVLTNDKGVSSAAREISFFTYDDRDHIIKEERSLSSGLGKKMVTIMSYDSLDRLVKKSIQKINQTNGIEDSKVSSFSYDPILETTLLKTANNEIEKLSFTHEDLPPFKIIGSSIKAVDSKNSLGVLEGDFVITRDFSGEIATLKNINGTSLLSSQYDPAGRLLKISSGDLFGNKGARLESVIAYDDLGRKVSVSNSDGFSQQIAYDQLSRVTAINWKNNKRNGHDKDHDDDFNVTEQLSYDLAGNIVNSKREHANTVYGYDELNQLISENSQHQNRNLQYDQVGNRIHDSYNGAETFVNNAITGNKKSIFAYDLEGKGNLVTIVNEKEKFQKDFEYNLDNKLSSFQLSFEEKRGKGKDRDNDDHGILVSYSYDALGRRVAKTIQKNEDKKAKSFTQSYLYLADEEKILLARSGHGELTEYIDGLGIDEHLGEVSKEKAKSYITDHLGSVLNTEAAEGRKMFGAFGDRLSERGSREAFELEKSSASVIYGFAGREYDLESGLYYNRARMYNPEMGRFVSKDPIGFNGEDINLYGYVLNNPVNFTDPNGKNALLPVLVGIGIIGVIIIDPGIRDPFTPTAPYPRRNGDDPLPPNLQNPGSGCEVPKKRPDPYPSFLFDPPIV